MKYFFLAVTALFFMRDAKAYLSVDLNEVCANNDGDPAITQSYSVGNTYLSFNQKDLDKFCQTPDPLKGTKNWHLNIFFGPFLAYYHETEMSVVRDDKELMLSHISPTQRHSMRYYDLTQYKNMTPGHNPFQMFDEPQNRLTVEYQNVTKSFSIGIEYIHPKIIFYNNENRKEVIAKNPSITDNIGTDEERVYLAAITTTKSNVIINLYMNKRFELVNIKNKFKVEYVAGAGIGVHGSDNLFEFHDENWNRLPEDNNWNVQGFAGSLQNRLELSLPKTRLSLRLGHDLMFIRYNGAENNTRMKANIWGQFVSAQIGIRLH